MKQDEEKTSEERKLRKVRKKQIVEPDSDEEILDGAIYNKCMYGYLIEEVDSAVENTVCVIAKKFQKHYVCRFSAGESLGLFPISCRVRRFAIYAVTHQYFNNFIIFTILCNCVTLAMSVNRFNEEGELIRASYDIETDHLEYAFLAIYLTEMFLKIIAKGFARGKFSYMRNRWNMVDFIVVSSGLIASILEFLDFDPSTEKDQMDGRDKQISFLHLLRLFRVFRAVKTITVLPGLRTIISALLKSAVQLLEVMALNCFCLMIFALFALVMYMGKLRQKCVVVPLGPADDESQIWDYTIDQHKMWYNWINNPAHWAMRDPAYPHNEYQPCGNYSFMRHCSDGYICLEVGDTFDDGWTGFDNIFMSLLTTFQLLTTDFWERPYELVLSTCGPWSIIFFLVVLFFGSFYLLNLMLAVVAMSYETEAARRRLLCGLTKKRKFFENRASSSFSFEEPHRLDLQLMDVFRKKIYVEEEIVAEMNRTTPNRSFISLLPNKTNLGDTIWGLIGRKLSDGGKDRIGSNSLEAISIDEIENKEKGITIEIDTTPKAEFQKPEEKLDLKGEFYVKLDQSDKYPRSESVKKHTNLEGHIRLTALILRRKLRPIVNNPVFDTGMTFFIILNTLFFALEHHGMSETMIQVLEGANFFFVAIFTIECILKLLALQKEYFAAGWNVFDIFLVLVSYLDMVLPSNTTYLRSMRLLRIFKLAQSWITMKVLLSIILATFGAVGNLVLLLIIVIYVLAILCMQVIGRSYSPDSFGATLNPDSFPRWNFQNFWHAFLVVFRVICGEWIELSFECFTAHKESGDTWTCFSVFMPSIIFGNYIVLNLFLALLLDSFNTEDLAKAKAKELEASGKAQNLKKIVVLLMIKNNDDDNKATKDNTNGDLSNISQRKLASSKENEPLARIRFKAAARKVMIKNRVALAEKVIEKTFGKHEKEKKDSSCGLDHHDITPSGSGASAEAKLLGNCFPKSCMDMDCETCEKLGKLDWRKWDRFRVTSAYIVGHSSFEWTILSFIFLSSITLCFEDIYLESRPTIKDALFYLNFIFCVIFIIEMILKWFAFGLWGYFSNAWCILDFFIVVISLITLHFDIQLRISTSSNGGQGYRSNLAALKALRTLRALRPLRAISRWEGMKIVVNALIYAIPLIFNVFQVCLLFWLIFSIMGVQLFKGKFWKCVDSDGERINYLVVPTKRICCAKAEAENYSWINAFPSFDNVLDGYLSLFQIATYEGWIELMAAGIDSDEVDLQPKRENQPLYYIFFLIFIVFGAFFTLNLFIGVMVDNFGMLKKKYEGNLIEILLTPSQRNYLQALKKVGQLKPQKLVKSPNNKFLCVFYDLTMSRRFEITIFSMIFLNLFVISFEVINQSHMTVDVLTGINSFFTVIYILECVVKVLGLRHYYFVKPWNILDFALVMTSLADLLLVHNEEIDFPIPPTMLRVLRVIRIGKVLRLVKSARGIRKLLNALVVSLPALGNIGALIALITFIYAILGMATFSGAPKFEAVDQIVNWDTFLNSCFVLLRLLLAAGWNDLLDSLTQAPTQCGAYRKMKCGLEGEPDCPNKAIAITYFVSYILIVFLIIINMYTAIILENYEEACNEEEGGITEDDLDVFYIRWARFDPQATQFIRFEHVSDFLASLDPPFRCRKPNIVPIVAFNLPICRGNKIHCLDILYALVKHVVGNVEDNGEFKKLQERMEHKFHKQFPSRKLLDVISSTRIWKIQLNAAVVIQRAWRAYYRRTYPDGKLLQNSNKPAANKIVPQNSSK